MSKSVKQASEDESLAAANAEIRADIEARAPADGRESSITLVNLQANPMSALGLESYGEVSVTEAQMACPRFSGKVKRAIDLGLIMVKAE